MTCPRCSGPRWPSRVLSASPSPRSRCPPAGPSPMSRETQHERSGRHSMSEPQPLAHKVAIVTGAARGIGAVVAESLARDGAHVVLVGRDERALTAHARHLDEAYPRRESLAMACDVTDEAAVRAMTGQAAARFGGLDILVNTAGVTGPVETPAQDYSAAAFPQVLEVNVG